MDCLSRRGGHGRLGASPIVENELRFAQKLVAAAELRSVLADTPIGFYNSHIRFGGEQKICSIHTNLRVIEHACDLAHTQFRRQWVGSDFELQQVQRLGVR